MTIEGKRQSIPLTEGPNRAAARSYLRGVGFSKEDLHKPIIGVANTWTEIGPCNFHLRDVAAAVKQGIREAGGTPMEFNTVTIHDGITMGTQGMKASLVSREVIADSVELVARGNLFDGIVGIGGCDKNMPAMIMALCRLNIPGIMLYGGSIAPGKLKGPDGTTKDITILNVFEAIGSHAAGTLDDAGLEAVEANACPGAGACGGQFTANTMAMAAEILGISPIQLSGVPAMNPEKYEASRKAGHILMDAVRANRRPSDIITRASIENAIASVAASGGSTNAVLHFLAIAREMGIDLSIDDFDRISDKTPFICDLSPAGKYVASDYQAAGGSRLLAQRMLNAGLLNSEAMTVSGKTIGEEASEAVETPGQQVIKTFEAPIKAHGGLVILKGNLSPEGSVMKIAAADRVEHRGPARVFDSEDDCFAAVQNQQDQPRRRPRHSLRRPKRRPGHERDAASHSSHQLQSASQRHRSPHDRRPFQRCNARLHSRPRRPRSLRRRTHSSRLRRRHHPLRHRKSQAHPRSPRRRNRQTPLNLESPRSTLQKGSLRQVRQSSKQRRRRRNHHVADRLFCRRACL
jgi:dihydroxy-acid dehydratase